MEKDFNLTDNTANVLSPSGRELERGKFCHIHMNSPKRKLDGVKSTFCSFLSLCFGCKEKEMNQRKRICARVGTANLSLLAEPWFCECAHRRQIAFTMAEVLIVLGILGLVADMTIPTLITKVNDKALQTAKIVANLKFEEALNQMRANDKLTGYDTAESFANEFTRYIKTAQRCTSDNLTNCFPEIIKTESKDIKTNTLTTGEKIAPIGKQENYPSNNVGLTLPSGIMAIMNYDKDCEWKNPLTGGGTNRQEAMTCISMVYDVNGRKKPNKVGADIMLLNADIGDCLKVGSICIDPNDTPYGPINTCDGSPDLEWDEQGSNNSHCSNNKWAGAKKACKDRNMHLATAEDLGQIAKAIYNLSSPPAYNQELSNLKADRSVAAKFNINLGGSVYWASREYGPSGAYVRDYFPTTTGYDGPNNYRDMGHLARCVR